MLGEKHWEREALCVYLTVMDTGVIFKNLIRHFPNVTLCKQCEATRLSEHVTIGLASDKAPQQAVHGPMSPEGQENLPPPPFCLHPLQTSPSWGLGHSLTGKRVLHIESSLKTLFL